MIHISSYICAIVKKSASVTQVKVQRPHVKALKTVTHVAGGK